MGQRKVCQVSKIWFTSDLHFMHKRIVEFTDRKYATSQQEHDQWLIDLWNSQVNPSDHVYHLGDFCFSREQKDWVKIIKQLHGQKTFVKGNHDASDVLKRLARENNVVWHDYKQIKVEKQDIILFHFPIGSWEKQRYGSWHLHGHSHGNYADSKGKMLDVGLDSAYNIFGKHQFFEFSEVKEIMEAKEIYISDNHRSM
jgi:calcineurin-like phosphoesterase family protein